MLHDGLELENCCVISESFEHERKLRDGNVYRFLLSIGIVT